MISRKPEPCNAVQHRDVTISEDEATGERIPEIEVRGKRGVGSARACRARCGFTKGKPKPAEPAKNKAADGVPIVVPARQLPLPTDHVFPGNHIKLFNGILRRINLKLDRDRDKRVAYSLRQTYICMRLMGGGHLPDRQELPHQRGDDRKALGRAHQEHARCRRHQRGSAEAEAPRQAAEDGQHCEQACEGNLGRGLVIDFLSGRLRSWPRYRALAARSSRHLAGAFFGPWAHHIRQVCKCILKGNVLGVASIRP
jgi:hypothetical protein